jgi:hypothetical protein
LGSLNSWFWIDRDATKQNDPRTTLDNTTVAKGNCKSPAHQSWLTPRFSGSGRLLLIKKYADPSRVGANNLTERDPHAEAKQNFRFSKQTLSPPILFLTLIPLLAIGN